MLVCFLLGLESMILTGGGEIGIGEISWELWIKLLSKGGGETGFLKTSENWGILRFLFMYFFKNILFW